MKGVYTIRVTVIKANTARVTKLYSIQAVIGKRIPIVKCATVYGVEIDTSE